MKDYVIVLSQNSELSDFFIQFLDNTDVLNRYDFNIIEHDAQVGLKIVKSTCTHIHQYGHDIFFDIYNQLVFHHNNRIMLVRLNDKIFYTSLLDENIAIYNERKVNYLITNKDIVTTNSVETIRTETFFEKLFSEGSGALYAFHKEATIGNEVNKTINDYTFALENPEQVFKNPLKIYLQLLDNCTKRCQKCIYNPRDNYVTRRDGHEISFSMLEKLFQELSHFEIKPFVEPSFDCEPLMYSRFEEFLSLASHYEIPLHIITNGMLLSDEKIDLVLRSKEIVNIVISVDALTQDVYRELQSFGKLSKVEKNIERLLERRGNAVTPNISICFTESQKNSKDFSTFLKKWIDKGVDSVIRNHLFGEENEKKFSSKYFKEPTYGYCFPQYTDMFVSCRGELFNCHQDVLLNQPLAKDFSKISLMQAYHSPQMLQRRERHRCKAYEPQCVNCLEFAVCESIVAKEESMFVQIFPFHKIYYKGE